MNQLKEILSNYRSVETQLLARKAMDIMALITDEELVKIYTDNNTLFAKLSNLRWDIDEEVVKYKPEIEKAIDIFIATINNRTLTKDEFEEMTIDEIKDYITLLITNKSDILLEVINKLEHDSRN